MRKDNVFIGRESFESFVKEQKALGLWYDVTESEYTIKSRIDEFNKIKSELAIDGFTEAVEVFDVYTEYTDSGDVKYRYLNRVFTMLKCLKNKNVYQVVKGRNEGYRFLIPYFDLPLKGNRYFEYNEKEPNKVGKATVKKLQAWFDYLDAKFAALLAYIEQGKNGRAEFLEKLKRLGIKEDEIKWDGKNILRIVRDSFEYKAEFGENGSVYESWQKHYLAKNNVEEFLRVSSK